MAILHETTLVPGKLEILASWLPTQPWYLGSGGKLELARVGGFRLDDPEGEVGIQIMAVTDTSGGRAATYQTALTYRGSACAEAADGLICTAEHGVLGRRWIYDATFDPVFATQLTALLQGATHAQSESASNTPDPTVISQPLTSGRLAAIASAVASNGPHGTDLRIRTAGAEHNDLVVHLNRVLKPADGDPPVQAGEAYVAAPWRAPDGTRANGVFATARFA